LRKIKYRRYESKRKFEGMKQETRLGEHVLVIESPPDYDVTILRERSKEKISFLSKLLPFCSIEFFSYPKFRGKCFAVGVRGKGMWIGDKKEFQVLKEAIREIEEWLFAS